MDIRPSIVKILKANSDCIVGTGFVVADNLILTCMHVVDDAGRLDNDQVRFQFYFGNPLSARIICSRDQDHEDVALFEFEGGLPFEVKPLRFRKYHRDGESIHTFGYAPPTDLDGVHSEGIVSGSTKDIHNIPLLQIKSNQIRQGHSGAPILSKDQRVIGMVVAITTPEQYLLPQDIALAIPTQVLFEVCPQIPQVPEDWIGQVLAGLDELPKHPEVNVRNFIQHYIGNSDHPTPFGGRQADLERLNAWLNTPDLPSFATLIAPGGMGKSSLLAHWVKQLAQDSGCQYEIAYFPINLRYETHLEWVVFTSLAARLAFLYDDPIDEKFTNSLCRDVLREYFNRKLTGDTHILVIIDGLDEIAGQKIYTGLFPTEPNPNLKILVSARPLAGDIDRNDWLMRLGWGNQTKEFLLKGLDKNGITNVMTEMGHPLDTIAERDDIIQVLYKLTRGDPLLVGLYIDYFFENKEKNPQIILIELKDLKPGLGGFLKNWFQDQQKLWGDKKPWKEKTVFELLKLCAIAEGPLRVGDILTLAPETFTNSRDIIDAAQELDRFLVGDGNIIGFTFSHPRLGEYFSGADWMTEKEKETIQQFYLEYGKKTLFALIKGELKPSKNIEYPVKFYGVHLSKANNIETHDIYGLMHRKWYDAWMWVEGTPIGYLDDVDRAWQQAEKVGPKDITQIIRSALCRSNYITIGEKIPSNILIEAVKAKIWSPTYARVVANQKKETEEKISLLTRIIEIEDLKLSEKEIIFSDALQIVFSIKDEKVRAFSLGNLVHVAQHLPVDLINRLLDAVLMIHDKGSRAILFSDIAQYLPFSHRTIILSDALKTALTIINEDDRVSILGDLIPNLMPDQFPEVFQSSLEIKDAKSQAYVLRILIPYLDPEQYSFALDKAINAALTIPDELSRISILSELISFLPYEKHHLIISNAYDMALTIREELKRIFALGELASHLTLEHLSEVFIWVLSLEDEMMQAAAIEKLAQYLPANLLLNAVKVAFAFHNEKALSNSICSLAPYLQSRQLSNALSITSTIRDEGEKASIFAKLAPYLSPKLFPKALKEVRVIRMEWARVSAISGLIPYLPQEQRSIILFEALQASLSIQAEWSRVSSLNELAPLLPPELLSIALNAVLANRDEEQRSSTLSELAPYLSQHSLTNVLHLISTIQNEWGRATTLNKLSRYLPPDLLTDALQIATDIKDSEPQAYALGKLVCYLPYKPLYKSFKKLLAIEDESARASILGEFAHYLPCNLIPEVLNAALVIKDDRALALALGDLAPYLPPDLLPIAIQAALSIKDEIRRASALRNIANHLPIEQRSNVLLHALQATMLIKDDVSRVFGLSELLPLLTVEQRAQLIPDILEIIFTINDTRAEVSFLSEILPYLTSEDRSHVLSIYLNIVLPIQSEWELGSGIRDLAPFLSSEQLINVLQFTLSIEDESKLTIVLEKLIPYLPSNLLQNVEQVVLDVKDDKERAQILSMLAPLLPQNHVYDMVQTALAQDVEKCIPILSNLMPYIVKNWTAFCKHQNKNQYIVFSEFMKAFAKDNRTQVLSMISTLSPIIFKLGGKKAIEETAQAILEICVWWP